MNDVKACRICLEMDVTLHNLHFNSLERYYQVITGTSPLEKLELPMYACYECAAMLKKFYMFREKSLRGQVILDGILESCGKITEEDIKDIDRKSFLLHSSLTTVILPFEDNSATVPENVSIKNNDDFIKQEPYEDFKFDDIVSESYDNDWLSDDEPLSIHKSRKKKKSEKKAVEESPLEEIKEEKLEKLEADLVKVKKMKKIKVKNPEKIQAKRSLKTVMNFPNGCIGSFDLNTFVTVITLTEHEQREEIRKRQESENYQNSNFKCELCFKGFLDTQTWQHHAKKHDETSGSAECDICKLRFKTRRILSKHVVGHAKKYLCNYCPYVSRHVTQAKQHLLWHQGVMYKCPYCDEMQSKWTSYLSHVRMKHPSDFICGFCGYSFVSKLGLTMHKTMMHKDLAEPAAGGGAAAGGGGGGGGGAAPYCELCDVRFATDEAHKRHLVTARRHIQTAENKHGCRECGEAFPSAEELRAHTRRTHAAKWTRSTKKSTDDRTWPVTCPHCSEEIASARLYWAHFRRHHPDKDYPIVKGHVCEVCGKGFRSNACLMYHKRTHETEKTFKCKECGKSFYNRGNLLMHEKTHSELRPYVCSVCGKGFKSKGALERHFRSHTGDKPYKCEVCGKAFGQSNTCKLHVRTVHLKQPSPYVSRSRLDKRNRSAAADRPTALPYGTH